MVTTKDQQHRVFWPVSIRDTPEDFHQHSSPTLVAINFINGTSIKGWKQDPSPSCAELLVADLLLPASLLTRLTHGCLGSAAYTTRRWNCHRLRRKNAVTHGFHGHMGWRGPNMNLGIYRIEIRPTQHFRFRFLMILMVWHGMTIIHLLSRGIFHPAFDHLFFRGRSPELVHGMENLWFFSWSIWGAQGDRPRT